MNRVLTQQPTSEANAPTTTLWRIRLTAGDLVPADARLIQTVDLHIQQAALTGGAMEVDQVLDLAEHLSARVFLLAYLNSSYETGIRSPLDEAILQHQRLDIGAYQKRAELPFDFERRRLSVVTCEGGNCLLITKGAPESVLEICEQYEVDGTPQPFLAEDRERAIHLYQRLSAQGFRVLAVASRAIEEQQTYHLSDEQYLVLAGFLTFADPPLADAAGAIQALARDGVQVKILTGDNELVTHHVCNDRVK